MAASYWDSTQRRFWQFSKDELATIRAKLEEEEQSLVKLYPLQDWRHLSIYFSSQLNRLSKRLGVRQQAQATAQVYIKRFYTKVEIRRTNPYLIIATALYLACKMEESPQHIRLIVSEARSLWPDFLTLDTSKLGECEFFMISEMSSQLIIHQPYRTLTAMQTDFNLSAEEIALAWSQINDHYMTDLPLLYPPHVIALTAAFLAITLRPNSQNPSSGGAAANLAAATQALSQAQQSRNGTPGTAATPSGPPEKTKEQQDRTIKVHRFAAFLADSNVDIEAMVGCTQELISFYESYDQYNEKLTREQINRFVKARGLDKP